MVPKSIKSLVEKRMQKNIGKRRRRKRQGPPSDLKIIPNHCKTQYLVKISVLTKSIKRWTKKSPNGSKNGANIVQSSIKRAIEQTSKKRFEKTVDQ